jgi:hypothetical protein
MCLILIQGDSAKSLVLSCLSLWINLESNYYDIFFVILLQMMGRLTIVKNRENYGVFPPGGKLPNAIRGSWKRYWKTMSSNFKKKFFVLLWLEIYVPVETIKK